MPEKVPLFLVVILGLFIVSCAGGTTAKRIDEALRRDLIVGDAKAKIEVVLAREKIEFSFDSFNRRYQGIIRDPAPNKPKGYLAIIVYVYVDADYRYVRHESRNSYTSL